MGGSVYMHTGMSASLACKIGSAQIHVISSPAGE